MMIIIIIMKKKINKRNERQRWQWRWRWCRAAFYMKYNNSYRNLYDYVSYSNWIRQREAMGFFSSSFSSFFNFAHTRSFVRSFFSLLSLSVAHTLNSVSFQFSFFFAVRSVFLSFFVFFFLLMLLVVSSFSQRVFVCVCVCTVCAADSEEFSH